MAESGNKIEGWNPSPWTHAPNANVTNAKTMTSPEAQAARAKSLEVMAALKKGNPGDADRLMGQQERYDSLVPGIAALKKRYFGRGTGSQEEQ